MFLYCKYIIKFLLYLCSFIFEFFLFMLIIYLFLIIIKNVFVDQKNIFFWKIIINYLLNDKKLIFKYKKEINPVWEFRSFICQGEMTCCTFYHKFCYDEEIIKNRNKLQTKIQNFWREEINPILSSKYSDYTIDFNIDLKKDLIYVIEINPPPPISSTILFDWNNEADRNILQKGPFELRLLSLSKENILLIQSHCSDNSVLFSRMK